MPHSNQLIPPPVVDQDDNAFELLRVWIAQGGQHVSIRGETWEDPAAWGIMLVDLARHVSRMYDQSSGQPASAVLRQIRSGFDAEWGSPTDEPEGALSD